MSGVWWEAIVSMRAARRADGFTVQVTSGAGKAANGVSGVMGSFSWRVVARPKTDAKVERLVKARLAPKVDMANLPKRPPAPPVASTPPKKP